MVESVSESLLAYFEWKSVDSNYDVWAEGAEVTREWIALMEAEGISQQQVDALLARIAGVEAPMMFNELYFQMGRWAHGAGWRVP